MDNRGQIQGIIFDMDNTILKSTIDFPAMKLAIFDFLVERRILPDDLPIERHTTATVIELARGQSLSGELERQVWDIASRHELAGMQGAGLEPGVRDFLDAVRGKLTLTVVTNNALPAALHALRETGIAACFELIAGREQMSALKPSPSGYHYVLERCPHIPRSGWISLGDSWIDGKAANDAGVPFISYQTDLDVMESRGVAAIGRIERIRELHAYL
ncbi:HAD family hydrolase [Paenibacillus piri]|uniref:HAD family hydrolase n=1 Tax=Paenibacillus piri TaxID=2547395 RepID=A0A4R5KZD0_9BACL|nr:HAD family hydrolase [Paenibacillus piri]TDG00596.1 HAD family hydrolase [Paenibacillus piri]